MNLINKFIREEEGAAIAEYIIVLGIMAMIAIFLGPLLKTMFGGLANCANEKVLASFSGGASYYCS